MRIPQPALLGRTALFLCVLFAPTFAFGDSARPAADLDAREARVDRLIRTGRDIEAFSESVKILRERLEASGPESPECAYAMRRVAVALRSISDPELAASTAHLSGLTAAAALNPCHWFVADANLARAVNNRWASATHTDITAPVAETLSMLDLSVSGHRSIAARAHGNLGTFLWRRDLPRAIENYEEAVQLLEAVPDTLQRAITESWLAWTLTQAGRHDEARYHIAKARGVLEELEAIEPGSMAFVEGCTGDLAVLDGDWESAERHFRRCVELSARNRRISSTRFYETSLGVYPAIALAELERGETTRAWQSFQYYRGLFNKRLRSLERLAERAPETYARLRTLREAVDAKRELRLRRDPPRSLAEVNWDDVLDELEANAELFRLEAECYAPEIVQSVSLAQLQSALPDHYAYIGWLYVRMGDELLVSPGTILDTCWMYVVRSNGPVHWIPIWKNNTKAAQNALRKTGGDYGHAMANASSWTLRVSDDPRLAREALSLGQLEFNPALPFLDGVDCLVVEFFDDRVTWKPVEALRLPDGRYVGDRFAVAYSPSADAFVASRQKTRVDKGRALVVGDPIFDAEAPLAARTTEPIDRLPVYDRSVHRAAAFGNRDALKALPRLRYAETEMADVQRIFPRCTVLSGTDATEANLRRLSRNGDLRGYGTIHFATHALSENPLAHNSALALTRIGIDDTSRNDGVVDALEMQLGWRLDADLVTLSGCRTLIGAKWDRWEPSGLAGVMLGVGARSVLATQWNVDDLASAKLHTRFYENLTGKYLNGRDGRDGKPMTKAAALAEAKRWLREYRDKKGQRPFAHPVYWSGFILMGSPD